MHHRTKQDLIPLLYREYVDYNGILGHIINLGVQEIYGTFPTWRMTEPGSGSTLSDVTGKITALLEDNEEILKEKDVIGRSPQHLICSIHSPGQIDVIKAMFSAKSANVNIFDPMQRTPLHHLLNPINLEYYSNHPDVGESLVTLIQTLLEFGANVNAVDVKGVTPLHLALDFHGAGSAGRLKQLPDILELLKGSGADMNKIAYVPTCRSGRSRDFICSLTPLHLACNMSGYQSIHAVKLLLSPENVNVADSLGRTPLHTVIYSIRRTHKGMPFVRDVKLDSECDFLLEKIGILLSFGADVNAPDVDEMTPLLTAIDLYNYKDSVQLIKTLITNGAVVTRRDSEKRLTPLHLACQYFDQSLPEILPYFINAGARLNVPDYKLITPFHYALKKQCCSLATLKYLVEAGAKVSSVDEENNNALHIVCSHRVPHFRSVVELLVEKGCIINEVNRHGNTPLLHLLQTDYNIESVQALIELGADCKVTNSESISPLHLVCRSLERRRRSLAYSKGIVHVVNMMIQRGADVNARDRSLSTPLFYAVKDEPAVNVDVVHSLLLAGANPNFANDLGMTPLHVVCSYGRHDLAKLLLCFGAHVDQVNSDGNTPLHEAVQARTCDTFLTCRILIDAGANVTARNYKFCTPFMMMSLKSPYKLIIGHVVLLISGRRYSLAKKEMYILDHNRTFAKFYADCFSCVSAMKTLNLGNSNITLWGFLSASQRQAHCYGRNSKILEDLHYISKNSSRFRPYSEIIMLRTSDCEHFYQLSEQASLSLNALFTNIPAIVSGKILSYLNECDMKSLNAAVLGGPTVADQISYKLREFELNPALN